MENQLLNPEYKHNSLVSLYPPQTLFVIPPQTLFVVGMFVVGILFSRCPSVGNVLFP